MITVYYFCYFFLLTGIYTDISFTGWAGPSCNTAVSSGVSQAEEKARTPERALASPFLLNNPSIFALLYSFRKNCHKLSTSVGEYRRKKMFGQSAFGSTAPTFGAASAAPAFGAAGAAGGGTGGMFGQTAAGGAFGAQKPAFGAGTTFGGTTGGTE